MSRPVINQGPNHALQRTAPCVTAPASTAAFPPTMQVPRRTPRSLSLGSLGDSPHVFQTTQMTNNMDMPIPTVKTISFLDHSEPNDTFITVSYEFTSGQSAELIPLGTAEIFTISAPSGQIEIPLGQHRKANLRTPDMETTVVVHPLSSR